MRRPLKKDKKAIFISSICDTLIRVVKAHVINKSRREFVGFESEVISSDSNVEELKRKIGLCLNKLGFSNNPVIVSLPRNSATLRYLRIPEDDPREIEKIVALQAAKYLPYPANELITGYQLIATNKEGYSDVNLTIVHKDVIERFQRAFAGLNIKNVSIVLNSYGFCNLYNYIYPKSSGTVMIIDIDYNQVELVIVSGKKLLFSRYFKLNRDFGNWQALFTDEINKTLSTYLKEVSREAPDKFILIGVAAMLEEARGLLFKETSAPIEVLSYPKMLNIPGELSIRLLESDYSYASLFGLGLQGAPDTLSLLPQEEKKRQKDSRKRNNLLQTVFLVSLTLLLSLLGIFKDLRNKEEYLGNLKVELETVAKEARPLEELEKRFNLLAAREKNIVSSLDVLYEVSQSIPAAVSLSSLTYEDDGKIILHGLTQELNPVFNFVGQLEKSKILKNFNVKVRYATSKKTMQGEFIDFEIVCLKK